MCPNRDRRLDWTMAVSMVSQKVLSQVIMCSVSYFCEFDL